MDLFYIFQASILSKIMNTGSQLDHPVILLLICVYGLYMNIPMFIKTRFSNLVEEFFADDANNSSIIIPYHFKRYSGYGQTKGIYRTLYSSRFHAINHHIKKYHMEKIRSITEIINFENSAYIDVNTSDFVLIPRDNQKIVIDEEKQIMLEIIFDSIVENSDDKEKDGVKHAIKKYIYKISKPGQNSLQVLNSFMESLEKEHINDSSKGKQLIFEYKKSYKDDEDITTGHFHDSPFITNKCFDNIFFKEKEEFIEFLQPFLSNNQEKYKKYGKPFKATIMLHGPPGCGKSSLIKSTVEYTKRHCLLVSWAKIKTCSEFMMLFRPIKIKNKVYNPEDLIIVFEDFDANNSEILKTRENLDTKKRTLVEPDAVVQMKEMKKMYEETLVQPLKMNDDELTLEYILNVLDGIVELNNSIVFFTTNDLESIDPALKRDGRIDKTLHMNYMGKRELETMLSYYYEKPVPKKYGKKLGEIVKRNMNCATIVQKIMDSDGNMDAFFISQ